ncbi:MAG: N-acyl-D-glucosamine 2-epimerase, partial [Chloroflexota bacterium]
MSNAINFTFSDTIAGYVSHYDKAKDFYTVTTSDNREYTIKLKSNTYAMFVRNLGDGWRDCTGSMRDMLTPGRFVYTYGVYYPENSGFAFEAQYLTFNGVQEDEFFFEQPDWWIEQIKQIGDFYLKAQFGDGPVDFRNYRTRISLNGEKEQDDFRQETDTISRLVFGFASAYLLTGDDRYLEGAEAGTEYLRKHMRFFDMDNNIVYWYHGIDVHGDREVQVFASEFGDDYDAVPAYEQIYALAGPIQTYRITGDPRILKDAELTVELFDRFFLDTEKGGYFSHLDPVTLDARSDTLGENRGKKNWNSVGDHAPAYLI